MTYHRFDDVGTSHLCVPSGLLKAVGFGCVFSLAGLAALAVHGQGGPLALRGGDAQPAMLVGEANATSSMGGGAGGGDTVTHLMIVGAVVVIVALLAFGVVLPCLLNRTVKVFVEALDKFIIGADVTMGDIEVSVLRLAFVMHDFKLLNPGKGKYKSDCVCKLRTCEGGVVLKSLICSLGKRIELRYLKVDGCELNAEFVGLTSNVAEVNAMMLGEERDAKGNITQEAVASDMVYVCHKTSIENVEVKVTLPFGIPIFNGGKVTSIPDIHSDRTFESTPAQIMRFVMGLIMDSAKEVTGSAEKTVKGGVAAVATGVLKSAESAGNSMAASFNSIERRVM